MFYSFIFQIIGGLIIFAAMAVVTLTTDLGTKDFYAASIKGKLYNLCDQVSIVDITHEVPSFDIETAAFNLKNSYQDFPKGSIHIIGVDPVKKEDQEHVVVFHDQHYFISADNGVFSFLFNVPPTKVLKLKSDEDKTKTTFPVKDVFAAAASHIANGNELSDITTGEHILLKKNSIVPTLSSNIMSGHAIYIDSMGNITANITKSTFAQIGLGRKFEISFRRPEHSIKKISAHYNQVPRGEKIALFNNCENLEIAINEGSAAKLFGIKRGDVVRVSFID
jgi:S-adenosyl-L-methionine hydrolase (adenosine-forming)